MNMFRNQLIQAVDDNQVLGVVDVAFSVNTCELTKYLAEAGYRGRIGCTHPNPITAINVANIAAHKLGEIVGYSTMFKDCTTSETVIEYMTEDKLFSKFVVDKNLSQYSAIVVDLVDERTVYTDALFGLFKELVSGRPEFRLVVKSACLDVEHFLSHFFQYNILSIPGEIFPVEIFYQEMPGCDYLETSLCVALQIHMFEPEGDILMLLFAQDDIDYVYHRLREIRMGYFISTRNKYGISRLNILRVSDMDSRLFEASPSGHRKLVIASSLAEAYYINGIDYIVDPGVTKQKVFDPQLRADSLTVTPISEAYAMQRSDLAGRGSPGKCFRVYTGTEFQTKMGQVLVPEVGTSDLGTITLMLKAMDMDMLSIDFMNPPSSQAINSAMEQLIFLGALYEDWVLTRLGRRMMQFPLDPSLAKMLLASVDYGCSDEMLTIIAMLLAGNVFDQPWENKVAEAQKSRAKFSRPEGDHLMLLIVYEGWKAANFSIPWCDENFIHSKSMQRASNTREHLLAIMNAQKLNVVSARNGIKKIIRAVTVGSFYHAARKDPDGGYRRLIGNQVVYIDPSSALFNDQPSCVIFHVLEIKTKAYMHLVTAADPNLMAQIAPQYF